MPVRSAIVRRLLAVVGAVTLAFGATAVVAPPASAQTIVRVTTTRGCEWTTGVGQYWRVKADVTVAQVAGSSYRWIESATNARTELVGFTLGVEESNQVASASIRNNGASVYISGSAVLSYGVPTPWGGINWLSLPINCSTTYSVY
ncbi:hypothetical protein ACN27F_15275 [Solwaraspora sp. WMMB335]|uniref:hypothetical protein n=1 Tax=Solwaraspora sp. WMMB335 TaxID=3404118 RepID=UPI003B923EC3